MGICFSKKAEPSSPTRTPTSNDPPKEKRVVNEKKETEATEDKPVFAFEAVALAAMKASSVAEEKEKRKGDTPVKKISHLEEEKGGKAATAAATAAADAKRLTPLRTSSCTKEEVDAILIQCGRLSRSSSGKTANETSGAGGQKRYSGSKRSYDFDNEKGQEEDEELDKAVSKPSPRRRTPNRERSGSRERGSSRERRMSRSPVKRSNGSAALATTIGDKPKQQPAKMVSVPAREKGSLLVNGEISSGSLGAKKISAAGAGGARTASPRSRSPANPSRICNENGQPQSLSRNSSRKAEQSPYKRNPLAEIEESSIRNQNGGNISMIQKNREMEEGAKQHQKSGRESGRDGAGTKANEQEKKPEIVEEMIDVKASFGIEGLNPRTLSRTRSSRRSSRDLDSNPGFNPASYASLLLEDIQNLQQQQQHTAFSLPACVTKACSILDAVADLNSSCSDHRSYEAAQSNNNSGKSFLGGFEKRGLLDQREPFIESELEVKNYLMEPSIHKYVTVRDMRRNVEPQESAGSNSFVEQPWTQWELNSVDSTGRCGASLSGNGKELEVDDEVSQGGNQQRLRATTSTSKSLTAATVAATPLGKKRDTNQSLTAATVAATPLGKKRDTSQSPQRQVGHGVHSGNGKVGVRAISLPVSSATS